MDCRPLIFLKLLLSAVTVAISGALIPTFSVCHAQSNSLRAHIPLASFMTINDERLIIGVTIPRGINLKTFFLEVEQRAVTNRSIVRRYPLSRARGTRISVSQWLPVDDGVYRYRVRFIQLRPRKISSRWSSNFSVSLSFDEDPPFPGPSPSPSPSPTPRGMPSIPESYAICIDSAGRDAAVRRVNELRLSAGALPVSLRDELHYAALFHSLSMAQSNRLSHDGFGAEVVEFGFPGTFAGQNVGQSIETVEGMIAGWMASDAGHRELTLNPRAKWMDIGCIADDAGVYWWTQHLAG